MRIFYFMAMLGMVCCFNSTAFAKHKSHTPRHHATVVRHRAASSTSGAVSISGSAQLAGVLNNIISSSNTNADIGVYVKSMQNGDNLYARNINQSLTPASTMKIFTAESALIFLKPEYRFSTQLLTDAKSVHNGVLQGNLYIVLSGDPSLTYDDLVELLLTLKSHQIQAIAGNVYIDNTAYDQSFYGPGWEWQDKNYCYAAPISASIINHNCLTFQVAPAKTAGHAAEVITSTKYFYPTIRNTVVTKPSRTRACTLHLARDPNSAISLEGCMLKGSYTSGVSYVVTDVPDYNRSLFKSLLSRLSVSVYGTVTFGSAPAGLSLVGQHASEPLRVLIYEMLKKSDNVIAGALFKKLGQLYTRQPGSWANGSLAVSQILARQAGVNINGMRILDGSGLSSDNLATPAQMMQVLNFAFHNAPTANDFITSLPIAGVDGTLKHRMYNIARKVRAKTGTISGVTTLAGYVETPANETLGFVIMINGSKGMGWRYKALEDKIVTTLTRYKR